MLRPRRPALTLGTARRVVSALLIATMAACSAADITGIEDDLNENTTGSGNATITLWTSDTSPSPMAVSVDGAVVGTLTQYRSSAPTCGASTSGGTITVNVSPGTHTVSARETTSTGVWAARSVSVSSGGCLTFEFTP